MTRHSSLPECVACIGLDLAWSYRNASGLAVLHLFPAAKRADLVATAVLETDQEILRWVERYRLSTTVIAIDAPIIAPNPAGTGRPCDRQVTSAFGRYHAGTYPAFREKCQRPIGLRRRLQRRGFDPEPHAVPRRPGLHQLEVYPHPAQIALFNLARIVKYKKGRPEERRRGLQQLARYIRHHLHAHTPRLRANRLLATTCAIDSSLRGRTLKNREDILDALVCAYTAAHFWFWGETYWRVFGDLRRGYIVCPDLGKWRARF